MGRFIVSLYGGRIGRLHFAVLAVIMFVVNIVLGLLMRHLLPFFGPLGSIIGILLGLSVTIATLQLYVRRFHDVGLAGWWVFLMFAADIISVLAGNVVVVLMYIFLCSKKGDMGENTYGTQPDHRSFADAFLNQ